MGNKSPGTRRNRLTYESQGRGGCIDACADENDHDKNGRELATVNANKNDEMRSEDEHIDSCHPAANNSLQVGGNNHNVDDESKSLATSTHTDEGKDTGMETPPISLNDEDEDTQENHKPEIPMEFTMVLDCIPENSHKVATLKFVENCPKTVPDLKQGIEDEFGIPTCCQDVFLENVQMNDQCSLKFYRVREGDTFHVRYNSEADVDDVLDIVASLCSMITYIERIQPILSDGIPTEFLRNSIPENIFANKVESLAVQYFYPCSSERANANRLLFVQRGGLDLMHKVHELLLLQPWQNIPIQLQYLEHAILRVLWNITASFLIRSLVLQRPTLKAITKSFLRVEVPKQGVVTAPANKFSHPPTLELNRIASEVVYKAAGSLCNLAELPECRMEIASNSDVLRQLIAVITTRTYKYIASLVSVAGMLCLAYSRETHPYLAEESIIEGIRYACTFNRPYFMTTAERRLDKLLLMYFSCVFYCQLLTSSPQLFSLKQKSTLAQFIGNFLKEATPKEIRDHEVKNGYKWSTVIPFVKLAYYPRFNREFSMEVHRDATSMSSQDDVTVDLNMLAVHCVEMGVFSMQNVLYDEEIRDVLVREGLVDYIVCMPWNVPQESRLQQRARELVVFLSQHMQLQPPSLVNVTKARLASLHFGLDRVLNTLSVHQLLSIAH